MAGNRVFRHGPFRCYFGPFSFFCRCASQDCAVEVIRPVLDCDIKFLCIYAFVIFYPCFYCIGISRRQFVAQILAGSMGTGCPFRNNSACLPTLGVCLCYGNISAFHSCPWFNSLFKRSIPDHIVRRRRQRCVIHVKGHDFIICCRRHMYIDSRLIVIIASHCQCVAYICPFALFCHYLAHGNIRCFPIFIAGQRCDDLFRITARIIFHPCGKRV